MINDVGETTGGWRAVVVRLMFDRKRKEGDAGSLLIPGGRALRVCTAGYPTTNDLYHFTVEDLNFVSLFLVRKTFLIP